MMEKSKSLVGTAIESKVIKPTVATQSKVSKAKTPVKKKVVKNVRNFPIITVEECLIIAQKLKDMNGGNPWTSKEVMKAIGSGATNKYFYITQASRDFGFTIGTAKAKEISLTDFGRSVVYAPNIDTEKKKKIEAFFNIPIFKDVLEYYKGSKLPEMKYLSNTLEDKFKLPPEFHEEFSTIFSQNCKELNIISGVESDTKSQVKDSNPTIIVGEVKKSKNGNLKAFVIMPFVERTAQRSSGFFKEVLESLLIPAGIEAGFNIETANKQGSDVIQSTIINDLLEADLVIADLTDHNPNVLFELGLRMAYDLPIAIIKSKDTGRIFDVDNMLRVYEYDHNLWKSTVEKDVPALTDHFKAVWNNRNSEQTYMKILRRAVNPNSLMIEKEG